VFGPCVRERRHIAGVPAGGAADYTQASRLHVTLPAEAGSPSVAPSSARPEPQTSFEHHGYWVCVCADYRVDGASRPPCAYYRRSRLLYTRTLPQKKQNGYQAQMNARIDRGISTDGATPQVTPLNLGGPRSRQAGPSPYVPSGFFRTLLRSRNSEETEGPPAWRPAAATGVWNRFIKSICAQPGENPRPAQAQKRHAKRVPRQRRECPPNNTCLSKN